LPRNILTPEEMEQIKSLGSWDEIMETLKQRLAEQEGRHQGGNKWIGTGGTSRPTAIRGYNPEGVRIGGESKHKSRAQGLGPARIQATSTTPANSARATSRSRYAACAVLRVKAPPTNSISTARSTAPQGPAGSTCACGPNGAMP
jgi:hypothetical protein